MSLPRYSEYKDSEVAWLGDTPTHCASARLSRIDEELKGVTANIMRMLEGLAE